MTLYVLTSMDKPGSGDLRLATREAHLAYVRTTTIVRFRVGGPFLSADGNMIGSMIIIEADDPAQVADFIKNDPYVKGGLFERTDVRPWKVTIGTLGSS